MTNEPADVGDVFDRMQRGLNALYLEVHEDVAKDVALLVNEALGTVCRERNEAYAVLVAVSDAAAEALGVAYWMSGSEDFSPGGKAREAWPDKREKLHTLAHLLGSSTHASIIQKARDVISRVRRTR